MSIVEFVWWSGSDEFLADLNGSFKPMIDYVSSADGCLRILSGLEAEPDERNFWMVVVWESHELHQAMMARPDYPTMVGRLKPFFRDGILKMNHVKFNRDTDTAFKAPVTAIAFITLKGNTTLKDLDKLLNFTQQLCDPEKGGHPPTAWGNTEEDEKQVLVISGWDSVEARQAVMANAANIAKFRETVLEGYKAVDVKSVHLKLRENFVRT
ncbi:hypothetical protein CPB84DRAFT_1785118 [Gymnopilus junonius]|uniref:ABM domain-containing protein n=1 Tax=Gymnopilus junonius TaxID=109634 RepID=A0A9P5TJY0_GYMJU|nr:hypothetical protein CPB84DRAFT_1785118 [Gymnopilus junonius]